MVVLASKQIFFYAFPKFMSNFQFSTQMNQVQCFPWVNDGRGGRVS